jgi:hypothetical protein
LTSSTKPQYLPITNPAKQSKSNNQSNIEKMKKTVQTKLLEGLQIGENKNRGEQQ